MLARDMMVQSHPIYACTGTNHAPHFIGSRYILRELEAMDFKETH